MWQVPGLGAERAEAPGVGRQLSRGLQDSLAAPQVVTGIPNQSLHTTPHHGHGTAGTGAPAPECLQRGQQGSDSVEK